MGWPSQAASLCSRMTRPPLVNVQEQGFFLTVATESIFSGVDTTHSVYVTTHRGGLKEDDT